MNARRAAAPAGAAVLILASIPLAAAGTGMVAAATWVEARGGDAPDWLLGIFGSGLALGGGSFYALMWVAFLGYLLLIYGAAAIPRGRLWGLIIGLVALFMLAPPLLSQDVFSYIAYARLGAEHGLNPYQEAPAAIAGDPVFPFVGWPDAVSVYGPLFTIASYVLAPFSVSGSLWLLKVATAAAVLGTAALCERMAVWRGVNPAAAIVVVALNPLVLVHVVGGAHNDAFMMLTLTAGCALLLSARPAAAGIAMVAACAVKLAATFAGPFALLGALREREATRFALGALATATVLVAVGVAVFGSSLADSVALVGDNQGATSRYSLPATASRLFGVDLELVRNVFLAGWAATVAWLSFWTWRGADWLRAAGWAGLVTLIATGWLLPWYLIWVLPLAAIGRDRPLLYVSLALTAFQLISRVPF